MIVHVIFGSTRSRPTTMLMCKRLFLCDEINRGRKFINTFFLTFQGNTERKRKIMKDEKKHHGAVDESSEQQIC